MKLLTAKDIMNDHDKHNLDFLLSISPDVLADWFEQADDDDINYAFELLARAKSDMLLRLIELEDSVEDLSEAKQFLQKFSINK